MLVSFLLPTRRRVDRLKKSLESLLTTCSDSSCYEVLLRIDDDDLDTIEFAKTTEFNIQYVIGPRKNGYLSLHEHVNEIAEKSTGEFLVLWNDDALMKTEHWDLVLQEHVNDSPSVYFPRCGSDTRNWFPIVNRKIYNAMSRFSESALNDFYMSTVARNANIEKSIAIKIYHDHPASGGQIRDEIYYEAVEANKVCKHDGNDQRILSCIDEDVEKIRRLLEQ